MKQKDVNIGPYQMTTLRIWETYLAHLVIAKKECRHFKVSHRVHVLRTFILYNDKFTDRANLFHWHGAKQFNVMEICHQRHDVKFTGLGMDLLFLRTQFFIYLFAFCLFYFLFVFCLLFACLFELAVCSKQHVSYIWYKNSYSWYCLS